MDAEKADTNQQISGRQQSVVRWTAVETAVLNGSIIRSNA